MIDCFNTCKDIIYDNFCLNCGIGISGSCFSACKVSQFFEDLETFSVILEEVYFE